MRLIVFLASLSFFNLFYAQEIDYFTDQRDGNVYKTVKIGEQVWMAENLKSEHYYDGTPIDLVTSNENWSESIFGFCYYDFNNQVQKENGNLYKYFTATDVCPVNWHLATIHEWDKLLFTLGKNKDDFHFIKDREETFILGNELKIKDQTLWKLWERRTDDFIESNQSISNSSGLSIMPSGIRINSGEFTWLGYETYFWANDPYLDFNDFNFGLSCYSLIFDDNKVKKNKNLHFLTWGASVRCVKDEFNSNLTKVHDSINQFSFDKQYWKTITTNNQVVSFNAKLLKNSKSAQNVLDVFKQNISSFDENNMYISSLSKDKKCFSLILGDQEQPCIYFFNIEKQTYHELNLCNQILWSSYSPNQDFVLYKTSPEQFSDDLTVYNIKNNTLNYINFYKQNHSHNDVGYVAPFEIIRINESSVNWLNQFEFEVIANIYSESWDLQDAKKEEIPAPNLRNEKGSATYVYTFNVELNKIVKTELIKHP